MIRRCLISYASNGREWYTVGLKRLIKSAIANARIGLDENNAFLIFSPDIEEKNIDGVAINRGAPDMPLHREIPYGFKPWLFNLAFNMGFHQVLWCDSTIVIHKPIDLIWKIAEQRGVFAGNNPGCPMRFFTSDDAMTAMCCPCEPIGTPADQNGISRDAMFDQIAACALAIDIRHAKGKSAFEEWHRLFMDGITFAGRSGSQRPEFRGHRHDQSAMSWITHRLKIEREPYGMLCYHCDIPKFPQYILANTGIGQK